MFSSNASSASGPATYIEDVFSTYLFNGTYPSDTIVNNGIDLATFGGLNWTKGRNSVYTSQLFDSARGPLNVLQTATTAAQSYSATYGQQFNSNGFTWLQGGGWDSSVNFVSWAFRKQPKFFDVVTYTGDGTAGRTVAHSLGSVPGCIIVKKTDGADNWYVQHRSLGADYYGVLNDTAPFFNDSNVYWNDTNPTSTVFTVGNGDSVNQSGRTYVAYLFAHDAGGFGLTGTDNVISCGSFTMPSSGDATITLGYEPQWVMAKTSSTTGNWFMTDVMRGWSNTSDAYVYANTAGAEVTNTPNYWNPTATGFVAKSGCFPANSTVIYIAIRRGPMKVPTDGTTVYSSALFTGNGVDGRDVTSSVNAPDFFMLWDRANNYGLFTQWFAKLAGSKHMISNSTAAEVQGNALQGVFTQTGIQYATSGSDTNSNVSGVNYDNFAFKRAPSFMDVVCYTGTGSAGTQTHNLGVAPELVIIKKRSATANWAVGVSFTSTNSKVGYLNSNADLGTAAYSSGGFVSGQPTATTISVGTDTSVNASGATYVAYLFATCAGVSKVGSYTGTGTTQQINCGFTAGARFIMIKRTDSTGDWYVYDSARGIVAGNDPYLLLNSTAAEVTGTDYVDTYAAGFELSSTAPAALNASGGTYIFLAIA